MPPYMALYLLFRLVAKPVSNFRQKFSPRMRNCLRFEKNYDERPMNGKACHYLNRDHIILATFAEGSVTIITSMGLKLSFNGDMYCCQHWAEQLAEDINSNFAVFPNVAYEVSLQILTNTPFGSSTKSEPGIT
jgi:hypothetical protein